MNFPNLFLSKLVIPKTKYCLKYQLKCADYRINFAMNCGSMSNPPSVPVYNPLTLDAQLTRASVYYLMESVDVELKFNNGRTSSVTRDSIGAEIDVVGGGGGGGEEGGCYIACNYKLVQERLWKRKEPGRGPNCQRISDW